MASEDVALRLEIEDGLNGAAGAFALAAVQAQTKAIQATASSGGGLSTLADQAGAATVKVDALGAAMGPLGGVLSKVSPEAGQAASAVSGLSGTFRGLQAAGVSSMIAAIRFGFDTDLNNPPDVHSEIAPIT